MLEATANYVKYSKMRAFRKVTVFYIMLSRHDKAYTAFFEEINAVHFFTFLIHILILLDTNGL